MISKIFKPCYMFYLELNHTDKEYEITKELANDVINHRAMDIYYKKRES